MEEILWQFQQQSRKLREQRADAQVVWDDSVARELAQRYLNSHEDENERMGSALESQQRSIQLASSHLTVAQEHARQADAIAKQLEETLQFFAQENNIANAHYNTFSRYNAESQSAFPNVIALIHQANVVC